MRPLEGAKPMRTIRTTATVCFVLLMLCVDASASDFFCLKPEVPEGFRRAKAVFVGEVEEITPPTTSELHAPLKDQMNHVRFRIEKSWKGLPFGYISIFLPPGFGPFRNPEKGDRFLIYAEPIVWRGKATEDLTIGYCNRSGYLPPASVVPIFFELGVVRNDARNDVRALDGLMAIGNINWPPPPHTFPLF